MAKIAILEPDPEVRRKLTAVLGASGHELQAVGSGGGRFLDLVSRRLPRMILLELELKGISGWDLLRNLRRIPALRRVLVVASAYETGSKIAVRAFEAGADEFLPKPFDFGILCASIEALLRRDAWQRGEPEPQPMVTVGGLEIDIERHTVRLGRVPLTLRPMEFSLLVYLVNNTDRLLTPSLLLEQVWKTRPSMLTRTVATTMQSLRRKLSGTLRIETVYGFGYRVVPPGRNGLGK